MTVVQARRIFSSRPPATDPRTREAANVLGEITEAKKVITRHFGGKAIKRADPGGPLANRLKKFQGDVVEAAYAELGVA